jgi:thiol-disulfide isomerase/thioredoxin
MKQIVMTIIALLFLTLSGEATTFEIFGTIHGEYKNRIYFFMDNDLDHKDSISAPIEDGKFYFKENAALPVLCRFHFGENTNIQEIYIDGDKTYIELSSALSGKTTGGNSIPRTNFTIVSVKGSKAQDEITAFNRWKTDIDSSNKPQSLKNEAYFEKIKPITEQDPKSKVSAYLIAGKGYLMGKAFMLMGEFPLQYTQIEELKSILDTSLHTTYEWENLMRLETTLALRRKYKPGDPFHNVILYTAEGDSVNTAMFQGKIILIDCWASWCLPCRQFNHDLLSLYKKYKSKNLTVVAISLDENENTWKAVVKEDKYPWFQLIDKLSFNGDLARFYDIRGVPFRILLNEQGKIIATPSTIGELDHMLMNTLP